MPRTEIKHIDAVIATPYDFVHDPSYKDNQYYFSVIIQGDNGERVAERVVNGVENIEDVMDTLHKRLGWYFDYESYNLLSNLRRRIVSEPHCVLSLKREGVSDDVDSFARIETSRFYSYKMYKYAQDLDKLGYDVYANIYPRFDAPGWECDTREAGAKITIKEGGKLE